MDLGRFHYALSLVVDDLKETKAIENIQDVLNNLSNISSNPSHPAYIENYKESLKNLQESMRKSSILSKNMEVSRLINEFSLEDCIGDNLFDKVKELIAENSLSPATALTALQDFFQGYSKKVSLLKAIDNGLAELNAPFDEPESGDSEIQIKIPVRQDNSSLEDLAKEAREWNQIIKTITEVFDQELPESKLKTISNGSWEFYLLSSTLVLFGIANCLKAVNLVPEELVKAKKIFQDLIGIKVPQATIDSVNEHINTIVETRFREIAEDVVNANYRSDDNGRKAELKTALTIALKKLSKKLSEGASVDLRLTEPNPPQVPDNDTQTGYDTQLREKYEDMNRIRLETIRLLDSIKIVSSDTELSKLLESPDND